MKKLIVFTLIFLSLYGLADGSSHSASKLVCSEDNSRLYQSTYMNVKAFALSPGGINVSESKASYYTYRLTTKYTCSDALNYIKNYARLKSFASSPKGLGLSFNNTDYYISQTINYFCDDYPLEEEFKRNFEFASKVEGLYLDTDAARNYAYNKIESDAFNCQKNF